MMIDFKRAHLYGRFTIGDLDHAELTLIILSQREKFWKELSVLEKGEQVKRVSHLFKLNPKLENGVLRVGGRLSKLAMPLAQKHPVILAKDSYITELLLRHIHQDVGHGGHNHMLSRLSEQYWVIGVGSAIRKTLHRCIVCRRWNARPVHQQMADLPSERIIPDDPPFIRVGVDCFGPFSVRSQWSVVKRYGVMFTCMAIRAIQLEVAVSLETDSFINVLRCFIARRGQVHELRSDNGTNFKGAEHELKEAMVLWNQSQIHDVLVQKGVKWSFNPPAGSHHGKTYKVGT